VGEKKSGCEAKKDKKAAAQQRPLMRIEDAGSQMVYFPAAKHRRADGWMPLRLRSAIAEFCCERRPFCRS
jgi:hypothetical protein